MESNNNNVILYGLSFSIFRETDGTRSFLVYFDKKKILASCIDNVMRHERYV